MARSKPEESAEQPEVTPAAAVTTPPPEPPQPALKRWSINFRGISKEVEAETKVDALAKFQDDIKEYPGPKHPDLSIVENPS